MPEGHYEKVFDLAKRRGFLYPAFELYGGAAGFYDYGPLGAQMKARLEDLFRQIFVVEEGCAEISTPAITVEPVLKASGHVDHFSDVVVTCKKCGNGFRADHLLPEELARISEKVRKAAGLPEDAKKQILEYIEAQSRTIKERPGVEVANTILTTSLTHDGASLSRTKDQDRAVFQGKNLQESVKCPSCGNDYLAPATHFNLMFKTFVGPGSAKPAYLRPETAQAMFVDFPLLYRYFREKLPFGVCQIGRAYRNEISPRQGLIRLREFNQMEVEVFFDPQSMKHPRWRKVKAAVLRLVPNATQQVVEMTAGDAVKKKLIHNEALGYYLVLVHRLLVGAGIDAERLRFRQHLKDEMAHYANDCWDAEFESDRFGWVECVGVADRGAYDLTQHAQLSGQPLVAVRKYEQPQRKEVTKVVPLQAKLGPLFRGDAPRIAKALAALSESESEAARDQASLRLPLDGKTLTVPRDVYEVKREVETRAGEEYVPRVIEPSFGEDRILYAVLEHNYREQTKEGEPYAVLSLPSRIAPITVGVFPLMPKDGLDGLALKVVGKLQKAGFTTAYDDGGTIGRRYARMDEVGTPFCVTVDHDSLKDRTVTVRDRDTTRQERVRIGGLASHLRRSVERSRSGTPPAEVSKASQQA